MGWNNPPLPPQRTQLPCVLYREHANFRRGLGVTSSSVPRAPQLRLRDDAADRLFPLKPRCVSVPFLYKAWLMIPDSGISSSSFDLPKRVGEIRQNPGYNLNPSTNGRGISPRSRRCQPKHFCPIEGRTIKRKQLVRRCRPMQERPLHKRFVVLIGRSSALMRIVQHLTVTALRTWCKRCLPDW